MAPLHHLAHLPMRKAAQATSVPECSAVIIDGHGAHHLLNRCVVYASGALRMMAVCFRGIRSAQAGLLDPSRRPQRSERRRPVAVVPPVPRAPRIGKGRLDLALPVRGDIQLIELPAAQRVSERWSI